MNRKVVFRLVGVILLQMFFWLGVPDAFKNRIEWPLQDFLTRYLIQPLNQADPRITIIDIDEYSLTHEGRWPWSREVIADLIDQLHHHYNVHLIGSDIIFPDSSDQQDRLAHSLQTSSVTTTLLWHQQQVIRKGKWQGKARCDNCEHLPVVNGWITNTPELSTPEQAHITPEIDADGLVRRIYPLACHDSNCVEMLALSLFRQMLQVEPKYSTSSNTLHDSKHLISLPLQLDGSYLIKWQNPIGNIGYVSASDVLHQRLHENALQGKIVIIGSTATGLHDLVPTPLAPRFPAVEIHGLLLQSLLDQHHQQQPVYSVTITLSVTIFLSALLLMADHKQRLMRVIPLLIALQMAWLAWIVYQKTQGINWPITAPIISSLITLAWLLPLALKEQTRMREYLHQQFSAYVPPAVIHQLAQAPEMAIGIHPQRHYVTVMFADLRHFSRFAETRSPEELATILRHIMDQLTEIVHQHGGTVDKYIGDAIMAFWGAPLSDSHHADNAVQAAIAMCKCIQRFRFNDQPLPCSLSVGMNSGDVVVGDLGSSIRRSYTVCGAAVNIAAHLEEMTRQTPYAILIGESSYQHIQTNSTEEYVWHAPIELKLTSHAHSLKAYPLDPFQT